MASPINNELVFTVRDRCRVCYTCVRECPVKAIRIINGQAEVISSRCIGCGNCTRVCSQNAKIFLDTKNEFLEILHSDKMKIACVAPSFPAEFIDVPDPGVIVPMLKKMGFDRVVEVAFGADMVAREYEKILNSGNNEGKIASDCPAIVYYVRHYHPSLVEKLAPIVSPMVAMARILRQEWGDDVNLAFIGPCIAKKAESQELNVVITFKELRQIFGSREMRFEDFSAEPFDGPAAGKAALFAVTRGKLHSVNRYDDICEENIIVASGRVKFREAIREFEEGLCESQHLDLLCCEGCIMGPGMSCHEKHFGRTTAVGNYVRNKMAALDTETWQKDVEKYASVNFSQQFLPADRRIPSPSEGQITEVLERMGKYSVSDRLNCGACGYDTCVEHAVAITEGLAETEMCLPFTIEKLHHSVKDLNITNEKLATAQQSLRQSEKLASMGQLSAGIAHELNNPLGVITMYSNLLLDEIPDNSTLRQDLTLIAEQADRCKKIVGGLLNFARKNQVHHAATDIVKFVQHSVESVIVPRNVQVVVENELTDPVVEVDHDQWMQVLTNIEKNAVEAMPEGGTLTIRISGDNETVVFTIKDTGTGISTENMDKIFTPFFTTKPIGQGTGLGLPLIYGIVKMHRGQVNVETNADLAKGPTGTSFIISIPRKKNYNPVSYGK